MTKAEALLLLQPEKNLDNPMEQLYIDTEEREEMLMTQLHFLGVAEQSGLLDSLDTLSSEEAQRQALLDCEIAWLEEMLEVS